MQFLDCTVHILVSFLQLIGFLLLLGCEQRPDLCHGGIEDGFRLGHGFLVDGHELGFRLVDDWLDLRLLIRGEVQRSNEVIEGAAAMLMPTARSARSTWTSVRTIFLLSPGKATRADRGHCY